MRDSDMRLLAQEEIAREIAAEYDDVRRHLQLTWVALALAVALLAAQILVAVIARHRDLDRIEERGLVCTPDSGDTYICRLR
jgi:hypothetical protein